MKERDRRKNERHPVVCCRLTSEAEMQKVDAAARALGMERNAWVRMVILDAVFGGKKL